MPFAIQQNQIYTYGLYQSWPEDEQWELIEGTPYAMTAPKRIHQTVVTALGAQLYNYFQGKPCSAYVAPLDVRLPEGDEADDEIKSVVQPDLLVVCDNDKLDDAGCRGAPDWVIEVLSPSTALKDMHNKRDLYERHRVREYWLVHPTERWVMIYLLDQRHQYGKGQLFSMDQPTAVTLFADLTIDWAFLG